MGISYVKQQCEQFAQALQVFRSERMRIRQETQAKEAAIHTAHTDEAARLDAATGVIERECTQEKNRRETVLKQALDAVNLEYNDMPEPHWQRMKHACYAKAQRTVRVEYTQTPINELFAELERLVNEMYRQTQQLRGAFVSPGIAGVVGRCVRPYRKKTYMALATVREKILRCAQAILSKTDLTDRLAYAQHFKNARLAEQETQKQAELSALSQQQNQAMHRKASMLFAIGMRLLESGFLAKKDLFVGNLVFTDAGYTVTEHLPEPYAEYLSEEGLCIPLYADDVDTNLLFGYTGEETIAETYTSVALDLLLKDPHTNVVFTDVAHMGGRYAALSRLEAAGCVTIWRTEEEVRQGLEALCRDISEIYRDVLGDTYGSLQDYNRASAAPKPKTVLFVEDLTCFTDTQRELLSRIAKNGNRAGVFVMMQINKDAALDKKGNETLAELLTNAVYADVSNGAVRIGQDLHLQLVNTFEKEKITAVCNAVQALHAQRAVVPLGPQLPDAQHWQKKSAARGIELAIGVDKDGNKRSLMLSEDKPYALIIGDVDAGKSSLLHAIMIQTLANYDDTEVKIAVGDFKNGAEFNVYATSKLPSVEAVVNDEDPDVMASFLRYYVGEMDRRQKTFEQLEACTDTLVRKYETYRTVWEAHGCPTPAMPRIILLVDEYQSLFENVSGTAALLNELVRKGRTYGIHIVMASQRATCDNAKNSFTGDLKNYFTSRFVFKAPQTAARLMLSERCADTGRENTGIAGAPLLNKGCAMYNAYMGQTEKDNCRVQCFYADDGLIANVCRVVSALNGEGDSILLRKGSASSAAPCGTADVIGLGVSPCLHTDADSGCADDITDDTLVSIKATQGVNNLVCAGADERVAVSVMQAAVRHMQACTRDFEVHVFGAENDAVTRGCFTACSGQPNVFFHTSEQEVKEELARQTAACIPCVNVFAEITAFPMLSQTAGALRVTPEAEMLKRLLHTADNTKRINIVQSKQFKNLRSGYMQVVNATAVYILGVGDAENIRSATADACRMNASAFDIPQKNAINAYYFNRHTDKFGKVILYQP